MITGYIPYGRQDISADDIEAVVSVLRSDYLTQGPIVPAFEKIFTDYTGAKFAVAVNSATSALHIACLALNVGSGDVVWTSPISFVASANAAIYCGASVDFVDIDPRTYNISVSMLRAKLEKAKKLNVLPKVIIPVHFAGQSCEMSEIFELSKQYNFRIIEDASHAVGGEYLTTKVGSCKYSDICIFSFHPVKIITTGEGGMALTNSELLAERMNLLRSHGIIRDPLKMQKHSPGPWHYEQATLGYNYRMTDIQAALGMSQISRLKDFIDRRRLLAQQYDWLLRDFPLIRPWQHPDSKSSYHLYVIRLLGANYQSQQLRVFNYLRDNGIGVNLHYIPIHIQPYYSQMGFKPEDFPNSLAYYKEVITLPLFPGMSDTQQKEVIQKLTEALL